MKKKILIVDDEAPTFARTLAFLMREYELCFEENGLRALNRAAVFQPDLLMLDLIMPEIHGLDLAARFRNEPRLSRLPIIIVSCSVPVGDSAKLLHGYPAFGKPIDMPALKQCIEQKLHPTDGTPLPPPERGRTSFGDTFPRRQNLRGE